MSDPAGAPATIASAVGGSLLEGIGSEVVVCVFILLAGLILVAAWLSTYVPQDMRPIAVFVFENFGRNRPGEVQPPQQQQPLVAPVVPPVLVGPAPVPSSSGDASTGVISTPDAVTETPITPANPAPSVVDAVDTTVAATAAGATSASPGDLAAYDVDVLESDGDLDQEMRERVEDVLNEYTQVMEAKNDSELRNRRLKYFNCLLAQPNAGGSDTSAGVSTASTSSSGTAAGFAPSSVGDTEATSSVVEASAPTSATVTVVTDSSASAPPPVAATPAVSSSRPPGSLLLRLKYFNDDLRTVVALPTESIANFKRKHFQVELSRNMNIRLIYNGRELKEGVNCTLASYAIPEEATIHCLITERSPSADDAGGAAAGVGAAADGESGGPLEGQGDIGSYMFPLFGGILGIIWYCRVCYKAYFNFMSTMALGAVTLLFFAAFFASWSQRPPRQTGQIHVHRINLDQQQQQQPQPQEQPS